MIRGLRVQFTDTEVVSGLYFFLRPNDLRNRIYQQWEFHDRMAAITKYQLFALSIEDVAICTLLPLYE